MCTFNVISTYALFTYVPMNIFTVHLPFFRLRIITVFLLFLENYHNVLFAVLTGFGYFWTRPFLSAA